VALPSVAPCCLNFVIVKIGDIFYETLVRLQVNYNQEKKNLEALNGLATTFHSFSDKKVLAKLITRSFCQPAIVSNFGRRFVNFLKRPKLTDLNLRVT
jgi:hypothetical protein